MFKKAMLALSAASMFAIPSAASAHDWGYHRYGYGYRHYPRSTTVISVGYGAPAYGYGYNYPAYGYGYGYPAYGYGYPAYGYNYPSNYGYGYGYNGYCRNNTATGAAIGGIAGAVLGSSVAEGGHHYVNRFGRIRYDRSEKGVGAVVGGLIGAVAGGAIASGNCGY